MALVLAEVLALVAVAEPVLAEVLALVAAAEPVWVAVLAPASNDGDDVGNKVAVLDNHNHRHKPHLDADQEVLFLRRQHSRLKMAKQRRRKEAQWPSKTIFVCP